MPDSAVYQVRSGPCRPPAAHITAYTTNTNIQHPTHTHFTATARTHTDYDTHTYIANTAHKSLLDFGVDMLSIVSSTLICRHQHNTRIKCEPPDVPPTPAPAPTPPNPADPTPATSPVPIAFGIGGNTGSSSAGGGAISTLEIELGIGLGAAGFVALLVGMTAWWLSQSKENGGGRSRNLKNSNPDSDPLACGSDNAPVTYSNAERELSC